MLVSGRVVLSHVVGFHPSFGRRYGDSGPVVGLFGGGGGVQYHMYRYIHTWNPKKTTSFHCKFFRVIQLKQTIFQWMLQVPGV